MGIVFQLAANFGSDEHAAERFRDEIALGHHPLDGEGYALRLRTPRVEGFRLKDDRFRYTVALVPVPEAEQTLTRSPSPLDLNAPQLTRVGHQLYDLLRGRKGYEVALAGWEADWVCLPQLVAYGELVAKIEGLVVSHEARPLLPASAGFVPFDPEHVWIPFTGAHPLGAPTRR